MEFLVPGAKGLKVTCLCGRQVLDLKGPEGEQDLSLTILAGSRIVFRCECGRRVEVIAEREADGMPALTPDGPLILTSDYEGNPKKPPTRFEVGAADHEPLLVEEVSDHSCVEEAYATITRRIREAGIDSLLVSSSIDHLVADGILPRD
jgi:hypothetical protein